jgi:uncharacterized protein (DUF2235 family)
LAQYGSNVVKLYATLAFNDSAKQVGYYRPSTLGSSVFARLASLLNGRDVPEALVNSYAFLMENFEPGDRVFLFGGGRGAYLARALAGMLQLVGLLRKGNHSLIPAIIQLMKRPNQDSLDAAGRFRSAFPQPCSPYFVGIWDAPAQAGLFTDPIAAAYMTRNPGISIGRHAISVDERRASFRPNLWTPPGPGQDLKQAWFAGVHSDVVGGYPEQESGLSKLALEWMLREAELAGLLIDSRKARTELGYDDSGKSQPDPLAPVHNSMAGVWSVLELYPWRVWDAQRERYSWRIPHARRRTIQLGALIHESVMRRLGQVSEYRPANLPAEYAVEPAVRWGTSLTYSGTQTQNPPLPDSGDIQSNDGVSSIETPAARTFPPALVNEIRARQCVVYTGAGVSATAGLPVWREFGAQLLETAAREGSVPPGEAERFRAAIAAGETDYVVDAIVARTAPAFLSTVLRSTFLGMREVPAAYRLLRSLPFAAALTTNFDNLLDRAFEFPPEKVRTPQDVEAILASLKANEFFLLHLYGTLDRPDTMLVSPAQFEDSISGNLPFRELFESLFVTRTILFVGCSLEGIEAYLRGLRFKRKPSRSHYAIAGVAGDSWQVKAGVLRERYGIEVIPYSDGSSEELELTISALRDTVSAGVTPKEAVASAPLTRLVLENIGPFPKLALDLKPDVNVFLGGNGVGKSTILRAIAAVLCGRQAEPSAMAMLRARQRPATSGTSGSIEIQFGRSSHNTRILTRTGGTEVVSPPVVPVTAEQVLALGFPPLRTASPTAGDVSPSYSEPVAEDLLPLVLGEPDFRLSALRSWIIRLDHQAKTEQTSGIPSRSRDLLDRLFAATGKLTEGVKIELVDVIPQTQQIIVRTDDGEVPFELVSQGTASLISWVGVILQRLYEVYPSDPDPTQRHFLVLMDEIDAHMHPQWQRVLLNRIREIFPNVQLLATTHSPLIIADLPWDRIFHVVRSRDEDTGVVGPVEVRQYEMRLEKLRSTEILLSPLFGLDYAQGELVEKAHNEYADLRSLTDPNPRQQARLDELARELFGRDAETIEAVAGAAYAAVERSLVKEIEDKPVDEQQKILDKAREALRKRMGQSQEP